MDKFFSRCKSVLLAYFILALAYIIYVFFFNSLNEENLSFSLLFYVAVIGGGGYFIQFIIYLLSYEYFFEKIFINRKTFAFYWVGGIIYAILILILFFLFDIFSMGLESFLNKEVFLADYKLFIVVIPILLTIEWFLNVRLEIARS
jgi:hypothetical protein